MKLRMEAIDLAVRAEGGVGAEAWCYEEQSGIDVVVRMTDSGDDGFLGTAIVRVPWRLIKSYAAKKTPKTKDANG